MNHEDLASQLKSDLAQAVDAVPVKLGSIDDTVRIHEDAVIGENVMIEGRVRIYGPANISGMVWIKDRVRIYGAPLISGNCQISDRVNISGRATIDGHVRLSDSATITGTVRLSGLVVVSCQASVTDRAQVSGYAYLRGCTHVTGNAVITGGEFWNHVIGRDAHVRASDEAIALDGLFEGLVTCYRTVGGGARVQAGCQNFPLDESEDRLRELANEHEWSLPAGWQSVLGVLRMHAAGWKNDD